MEGCKERRSDLMLYLDHELDPEAALDFEKHIEECPACARFVKQSLAMECLIRETSWPPSDTAAGSIVTDRMFLARVRARLTPLDAAEETTAPPAFETGPVGQPAVSLARYGRAAAVVAAAAAVLVLLWVFQAGSEHKAPDEGEGEPSTPVAMEMETAEREGTAPVTSGIGEKERLQARQEFRDILVRLDGMRDLDLGSVFESEVSPLRDRGWKVKVLLARALKREEGPVLLLAIQIIGLDPEMEEVPGVVASLDSLLRSGVHLEETMKALASFEGTRAEAALGRALKNPSTRDAALAHLVQRGGESAARPITRALLDSGISRGSALFPNSFSSLGVSSLGVSPFTGAALKALARMGEGGMEGILEIWGRSKFHPGIVEALTPPGEDFSCRLVHFVEQEERLSLSPGLRLAALLRLEGALLPLQNRVEGSPADIEAARLMARIGGGAALAGMVEAYQGPVSMRVRNGLCQAMADLFDLYPQELQTALVGCLDLIIPEEEHPVLIAMLAKAGGGPSCRALAWLVRERVDMAADAALGLARAGSREALDALTSLLESRDLSPASRVPALAAAYHLGGEAVFDRLRKGEGASAPRFASSAARRGVLTDVRFKKLQNRFEEYFIDTNN